MPVPADLFRDHQHIARAQARRYRIAGADRDDVHQEALIGLWHAARDYQPGMSSFPTFANMVITRRLHTEVRQSLRLKRSVLTDAKRTAMSEDGPVDLVDWLGTTVTEPARILEGRERLRTVLDPGVMTETERACLLGVALGLSYAELPYEPKAIDNAVQRGRKKLREAA